MIDNSTLLVGFPSSGKSTYLAALYHYVNSDIQPKSLVQYKVSNDTEYLNRIHNKWLSCEVPQRTPQEGKSNRNVILYLKNQNERQFTLNIPDMEGEVFKNQWELRSWGKDYGSLVKNATGIVFFVNISKLVNHLLISDMAPILEEFLGSKDPLPNGEETGEKFEALKEKWAHEKAPTQVRIVEILQFHLDMMSSKSRLPIAFVLSAWDVQLENGSNLSPAEWLQANLPLLYQFLESHNERVCYEVIGVSAQGGDYENKEAIEALRKIDEPAQRVKVAIGKQPVCHDIAFPINWILDKWKEVQHL